MAKLAAMCATILLVALALAGCHHGPSGSYSDPTHSITLNLDGGGGWTMTMDLMGSKQSVKGTYKMEGNKLTLTPTEVDGKAPTGADAESQTATVSDDGKTVTTGSGATLTKST